MKYFEYVLNCKYLWRAVSADFSFSRKSEKLEFQFWHHMYVAGFTTKRDPI